MTKTFCDICGKELRFSDTVCYKVKKLSNSCWESRWMKLTMHEDCWKDLCELVKEKQNEKR